MDTRPPVTPDMTASDFDRWYWPVAELKRFCEGLALPAHGPKAELRARVLYRLTHGAAPPPTPKARPASKVNYAKVTLTNETVITDSISFGPNVWRFFKAVIGPSFKCHGDFMNWMRANTGATFGDAITAWHMLEARHRDPAFRRDIAECNNYLRYLRTLRDANPDVSLDAAKAIWAARGIRPAPGGYVAYAPEDLALAPL